MPICLKRIDWHASIRAIIVRMAYIEYVFELNCLMLECCMLCALGNSVRTRLVDECVGLHIIVIG